MQEASLDSFKCRRTLEAGGKAYPITTSSGREERPCRDRALPFSLKVLLENLLRHEDGRTVTREDIEAMAEWLMNRGKADREIAFRPARVLMQDFTGVPAVVDLAAMRDAMKALGGDPAQDQSARSRRSRHRPFGDGRLLRLEPRPSSRMSTLEYERNGERYTFLKWGQGAFNNFRVVPPGTGICHQVNLEYLARTVWSARRLSRRQQVEVAYPRHAGRHRQPHHHGQRPRRARLGRRRHRGGSRDARPADLDADPGGHRLQAHRQADRGRHGDRSRAHRHADAAQEGRRRQIRRILSAPACRPCRSRTWRRSPTWRRNMARPAASSRSTQETLLYLKAHRPAAASRIALVEEYAKAQGMFRTKEPPTRSSPTRSSSISPRSSPRWPARSGRRIACRCPEPPAGFDKGWTEEFGKADKRGSASRREREFRPSAMAMW